LPSPACSTNHYDDNPGLAVESGKEAFADHPVMIQSHITARYRPMKNAATAVEAASNAVFFLSVSMASCKRLLRGCR